MVAWLRPFLVQVVLNPNIVFSSLDSLADQLIDMEASSADRRATAPAQSCRHSVLFRVGSRPADSKDEARDLGPMCLRSRRTPSSINEHRYGQTASPGNQSLIVNDSTHKVHSVSQDIAPGDAEMDDDQAYVVREDLAQDPYIITAAGSEDGDIAQIDSSSGTNPRTAAAETSIDNQSVEEEPNPSARKTGETSMNTQKARERRLEQELTLVEESEGRLRREVVLIELDPDQPDHIAKSYQDSRTKTIAEMKDTSSTIGKLVEAIACHRATEKERLLSDNFAAFGNHISAGLSPDGAKLQHANIFNSLGSKNMKDGDIPDGNGADLFDQKLDILVQSDDSGNDLDVNWQHVLTFGEVKSARRDDLRDSLFGQILRYDVSMCESGLPTTGSSSLTMWPLYFTTSASSSKITLSPVAPSSLRYAAPSFAYGTRIQFNSAPPLATISRTLTITKRFSTSSRSSPVRRRKSLNSGNLRTARPFM